MFDFGKRECCFVVANQEIVEALLTLNTHNRTPKRTAIESYQKDMEEGNFLATNQGIGVSKSGVLLDGQNRLLAMRACGYPPVEFLLVTGLEDKAQMHVDAHARRTQVDVLKLALNKTVSSIAIAALNLRQLFHTGDVRNRLGIDALASAIDQHGELLSRIIGALGPMRKSAVVAALLDYSLIGIEHRAIELAIQIGAGELLERTDPAYKIREIIAKPQGNGSQSGLRVYRLMISACSAHFIGKQLSIIKESESWPAFISAGRKRYFRVVNDDVGIVNSADA